MVTLMLDSERLEVVLTPAERALALRGDNIAVPRASITKAMLTDDAWIWLRGFRRRGTHLPGVLAAGIWKAGNGEDFVMLRGHKPSVVLELDGSGEFSRIILTTRHGLALVKSLRLDGESEAADVAAIAEPEASPSAAKKPAVKKAAAKKPAVAKPAVAKPAAKKPAVAKPAAATPAVKKPAVKKPAAKTQPSSEQAPVESQAPTQTVAAEPVATKPAVKRAPKAAPES